MKTKSRCADCASVTPRFQLVNCDSRQLCYPCFNRVMALRAGVENFQDPRFEPLTLSDINGVRHEFHFRTRLFVKLSVEAFEFRRGQPEGYQFQELGEPEDDVFELFARLLEKMRRALATSYLEKGNYGWALRGETVCARIESDCNPNGDSLPVIVIDGRQFSWKEFGHMLMTHEGFQFRLTFADRSEEP
jgi:hypothetical protein